MKKTKIEWCDSTWNPITGCLNGCEYCYAARQVQRFQPKASEWPEEGAVYAAAHDARCFIEQRPTVLRDADGKYLRSTPYPKGFAPTMHSYKLDYLKTTKAPRRIFIGSMADMFGDWIPDEWLTDIFRACHETPQHVYMFLTKNPARYFALAQNGLLPEGDNYWYGTTTVTPETPFFFSKWHKTFISIEPLMEPFPYEFRGTKAPEWVIVGAMTGPSASRHRP